MFQPALVTQSHLSCLRQQRECHALQRHAGNNCYPNTMKYFHIPSPGTILKPKWQEWLSNGPINLTSIKKQTKSVYGKLTEKPAEELKCENGYRHVTWCCRKIHPVFADKNYGAKKKEGGEGAQDPVLVTVFCKNRAVHIKKISDANICRWQKLMEWQIMARTGQSNRTIWITR